MRNAIAAFSISKEVNLDLKSLELMAYSLKLRTVSFRRTLFNEQPL